MKWTQGNFVLYDDSDRVDADIVHAMLKETYWAKDRSLQAVREIADRCLCFSLYDETCQIGFARVLTDYATFAIILDVVVREDCRGQGLGKWMMECLTNHPDIAGLRQVLWTADAEGLYQQYGFVIPEHLRFMVKRTERSTDGT